MPVSDFRQSMNEGTIRRRLTCTAAYAIACGVGIVIPWIRPFGVFVPLRPFGERALDGPVKI